MNVFLDLSRFICLERPCASSTCSTAKKCILRNWVLVPQRSWCRVHTQVQLLSEVLSCPKFRPQVPHSHIVKSHVYGCPWLGIYLQSPSTQHIKCFSHFLLLFCYKIFIYITYKYYLNSATGNCITEIVLVPTILCPLTSIHSEGKKTNIRRLTKDTTWRPLKRKQTRES